MIDAENLPVQNNNLPIYGLNNLKEDILIFSDSVECPVKGCLNKVERQRQSFKRETRFQCPTHAIFISPSTFEYNTAHQNSLWTDLHDIELLNTILIYKRESRMGRDNSEDALTWNVFRFLHRTNTLSSFLGNLSNKDIRNPELILWSYSPNEKAQFKLLNKARLEFGESISRGSEPDIIILSGKVLYFIEAKLSAKNETTPSESNNRKAYETGGNNLFSKIFRSDYETIAITEKRYELMRYWLLGNWMAIQAGLDFEFYSLVLDSREQTVAADFDKLIVETNNRKFSRLTWEKIYSFISGLPNSHEKTIIIEYFRNKTIGYDSNGHIVKAFNL